MKIKNLLTIISLVFLVFSFVPLQTQADFCTTCGASDNPDTLNVNESKPCGGIVPCGRKCDDQSTTDQNEAAPCQLCHVFVLTNNIIFGLIYRVLVPMIAVLMFVLGGFYLLTAAGRPEWFNKAKNIMTATVIGLAIIFLALVLVNILLDALGVADTSLKGNWWSPNFWSTTCPIAP